MNSILLNGTGVAASGMPGKIVSTEYSLDGLRETVLAALDLVSSATVHRHYLHCTRIIEAYGCGGTYGTKEFKKRVYKGHRQIFDKPKWQYLWEEVAGGRVVAYGEISLYGRHPSLFTFTHDHSTFHFR